jgi:Protein of unknown function (DUF2510)
MSDVSGGASSGPPPAGWYPNPSDSTTQRWWSGAEWTEHVQHPPVVILAPPEYGQAPGAQALAPQYGSAAPAYSLGVTPAAPPGGSTSTIAVWIFALYPLIWALSIFLLGTFSGRGNSLPIIVVVPILLILTFIIAYWDYVTLVRRGLPAANVWWVLLASFAYLLVRHINLKRVGRSALAPLIVYSAQILPFVLLYIAGIALRSLS